jgi:hypothetical protein
MRDRACEVCGITWGMWLAYTGAPCVDGNYTGHIFGEHPQGEYRTTQEGHRVWAIGGFITYD